MVKCPSLSESLTQHKDPAKKNSFNLNRPNDPQQMEDPNGRSFQKVEEPSAQKHRNKILVQ
jgi:hypothetical protein